MSIHHYGTPLALDLLFREKLEENPDITALVVDDRRWTRAEIDGLAATTAHQFVERGIRPGRTILTQYVTDANDLAIALAASWLGCTLIPVPPSLGGRELSYIMSLAPPALAVFHGDKPPHGTRLPEGVPWVTSDGLLAGGGTAAWPDRNERPPDPETALIGCTSGSTGLPKGVMHGWRGVSYAACETAALVHVRDGDPICTPGASAGAPGYTFFTYLGLTAGCPIVRTAKWNPLRVLDLLASERCVWSMTVVTMLHMLVEAARGMDQRPDLSALRGICLGGSAISSRLISDAKAVLGVDVLRMFGLSECMGHAAMTLSDPVEDRLEFDGRPFPGTHVRAFDDNGVGLPPGEVGEAGVRGPSLMQQYLGDADPASHLAPGGYFLTGDYIRMDPRGFVKVVGRKKDMIIRAGYNIDPAEVEELLRGHPGVLDVALVGVADVRVGEKPVAVVVPRQDDLLLEDLTSFLTDQGLSRQKHPELLVCRPELPLSPDGKVLKKALVAELEDPAEA